MDGSVILTIAVAVLVYAVVAYIFLPMAWRHHEHQPGLAQHPMVTHTKQGIPGDALNVGLVGERDAVIRAMNEAGWFPADPVTLTSSVKIVGSVLLKRPCEHAPVSPLFYAGRVEDLAFEKPSAKSADRRHHVRFWQVLDKGAEQRPVWLGAVTFDRSVGLSHYTGQVTHHIAADIDAERDGLIGDLKTAQVVEAVYQVTGLGPTLNGRNGGGDPYWTDGEIRIARLTPGAAKTGTPPAILDSPQVVQWKDAVMKQIGESFGN
ncbi:LssY C-terminal domain-containing protein [Pseudorhodoplanes sp.]|uniref:LssY C-terminal domain-containing protein n=1 Tax=Pseudorhodoplanes sp. TaxID=1934341 RepID=UPI00391D3DB2